MPVPDSVTGSVNGNNSIGTTVGNLGGAVAISINQSPPLTINNASGQPRRARGGGANIGTGGNGLGNRNGNGGGIGNGNGNQNGNKGGIGNGNGNGNHNGIRS